MNLPAGYIKTPLPDAIAEQDLLPIYCKNCLEMSFDPDVNNFTHGKPYYLQPCNPGHLLYSNALRFSEGTDLDLLENIAVPDYEWRLLGALYNHAEVVYKLGSDVVGKEDRKYGSILKAITGLQKALTRYHEKMANDARKSRTREKCKYCSKQRHDRV